MSEIVLHGLEGTNPLAFFAALGVLAATESAGSGAKLKWKYEGGWRPVLEAVYSDIEAVVDLLDADRVTCLDDPALALEYDGKRDLKPQPDTFHQYLDQLASKASPERRRSVDWAAAFATDVATDNNGHTKPTALHFTAGQQQFLLMVSELVGKVTKDDLRQAILGPWKYERPLPVMGWDGTSSRDYALRASDPSTDKKLGVPGADWLAVRGLVFFPTVPDRARVLTTGCVGGWKNGRFRWPLWVAPLGASVIRSILRLDVEHMSTSERAGRGIGAVFSSGIKRSDQGGYGSFEPATPV